MLIKSLELGHMMNNCYIVSDEDTLECAIIDPGDESNTVLDYLEDNKLKCKAIFLTHGHYDHTGAVEAVSEESGCKVYINYKETQEGNKGAGKTYAYTPKARGESYKEGDIIRIGSLEFKIMDTPGHSPGGVCIICQDAIFSGDTLFKDSCGRTDLPGGDMDTLLASLKRLAELPGDYEVYPGHMDSTTMDRERKFNYYVKQASL